MGFGFAKDIETAIDEALTLCGASARIGVLTHGADSAPLIEKSYRSEHKESL